MEIENLRVRFQSKNRLQAMLDRDPDPFIDAVCSVSLRLEPGETMALVGESGAGKTTLGRAVMGLNQPREGNIRFLGQELIGLSDKAFKPFRRDLAMMFQDPSGSLSPRLRVRSLITEPFRIHHIRKTDLRAEADRLLDLVGLPPSFAGVYAHQLSGGQARRIGVARALALSPKLIIADEPTAGLDVSVQGEILNLMNQLQEETGVSFLIITHNLNVVRHISQRMAIMYLGRFVEYGLTDAIFARPQHPYTLALLSANPNPDPDQAKSEFELQGEIPSLMKRPKGCEFHPRCPFAGSKCSRIAPETTHSGSGHGVACHYPLM
ncbi:MAG: ABC transporter ATP-binding protein [Desulfohalobiaceae bacterium]|nr:ABC transporter ATP-binding protein [Desulfohalobiaceae bacterium]